MTRIAEATPFAALVTGSPLAPLLGDVWIGAPSGAASLQADVLRLNADELAGQRERLLGAMTLLYAGDAQRHARALLSQWSKFYFRLAAPAAIAAALTLRRPLRMPAHACTVVLRGGMPAALYLPADALGPVTQDPARRYASLMREHMSVVIDKLGAMGRIAPRVLWSNAGNLLDALFEEHAGDEASEQASEDAAWLFGSSALFGGEPNPLRHAVRSMMPRSARLPAPFRARRVCCLRYEIPGEKRLCASCPLLLTMNDEQIAEQAALD